MDMIFGIGLAKTGTTTIAEALKLLGYNSFHCECNIINPKDMELYTTQLDKYNAIVGTPLAPFYKSLDQNYDNAKFILTIRDEEKWVDSCSYHFTDDLIMDTQHKYLHKLIYECEKFNRKKFLKGYKKYNKKVKKYFYYKSDNFLILDINSKTKWGELCNFLDQPIPDVIFPYKNKKSKRDKLKRKAK